MTLGLYEILLVHMIQWEDWGFMYMLSFSRWLLAWRIIVASKSKWRDHSRLYLQHMWDQLQATFIIKTAHGCALEQH